MAISSRRNTADCPSDDELAQFRSGTLSDVDQARIERHVADCATCASSVREVSASWGASSDSNHRRGSLPTGDETGAWIPSRDDPSDSRDGSTGDLAGDLPGEFGASSIELRVGPERIGQYEILARIGAGGMGVVYRARHAALDKVVALKLLPPQRSPTSDDRQRFRREMRAVGRLQHPNIVTAHDAGEADGRFYLALEWVDGLNGAELLRRMGPLAIAEACEIVRRAAAGLSHIHSHGMVHRDIKPSNLMLTTTGEVKLLDLGLALLRNSTDASAAPTESGIALGTLDFMAPEQIRNAHLVDIRADLYSFGCMLYQLLAGRAPFSGPSYATAMSKMYGHVHDPWPSLSTARDDVPPALVQVVERLLCKDPDGRPATPDELEAMLEPFVAGADLKELMVRAQDGTGVRAAGESLSPTTGLERDPTNKHRLPSGDARPPATSKRRRFVAPGIVGLAVAGLVTMWSLRPDDDRTPRAEQQSVEAAGENPAGAAGVVGSAADAPPDRLGPQNSTAGATAGELAANSDYDLARWGIEKGARIGIRLASSGRTISRLDEIPVAPYVVNGLVFENAPHVHDADLARIGAAKDLTFLQLDGTKITNDGLAQLAGLTQLTTLSLARTEVNDAGLLHLAAMKNLRTVIVKETSVTADGAAALIRALPTCKVER